MVSRQIRDGDSEYTIILNLQPSIANFASQRLPHVYAHTV